MIANAASPKDQNTKPTPDPANSFGAVASPDSEELAIIVPSKAGAFVRFFAYHLPLYMVVGALVAIAVEQPVMDYLSRKTSQTQVRDVPAAATANAASGAAVGASEASEKGTSDIMRMTLEDARAQTGSMKENYDRLFSLIAALAALLAFLGFRGLDTYMTTKQAAENLVKRAAKAQADAAKFNDFVQERYVEDNRAELNVTMGVVLRHVADSYGAILKNQDPNTDLLKDHKYRDDLDHALQYLKKALTSSNVDSNVAERAMSTMGNVYRRLGRYQEAIEVLEEVLRKYSAAKNDEIVYFNIACYSCLLAEKRASEQNPRDSDKWIQKSLNSLRKAIDLSPDSAGDALVDDDFKWFRDTSNQGYKALVESPPKP